MTKNKRSLPSRRSPIGRELSVGGDLSLNTGKIYSGVADSGSAIGFTLNTSNTLSTAGAKLLSLQNNGSEKFAIDKDGKVVTAFVPAVRVHNSASESTSNGVPKSVTFDTEDIDTDNMHSTSSNTSRLTCTTPGLYQISATVAFQSNATAGYRNIWILFNGGSTTLSEASQQSAANQDNIMSVSTIYRCTAGQYFEVQAFQNQGTINILGDVPYSFSAVYISP